jgi:ubiquinone/menaquinone biosynthesis C-methylase UbiE
MKNIFDSYYEKYDSWYDKNKFSFLSEVTALQKVCPKKGLGLEIGVGTGRFASSLGIPYGIDPSRNMLKIARQRGIIVRCGHGERLPYKDKTFDYVAIIIALCFVKDPKKVLKETKRILKDKGKIIIGIIDKESPLGQFYRRKKSVFYKQAKFFNIKEISTLLNYAGFTKATYIQTLFKDPEAITTIQKPEKGFGKGSFIVISAKSTNKKSQT